VLDTAPKPSIIYIWYEGGELRPPLVKLDGSIELALAHHPLCYARCPEASSADIG
jgi:hypothetical protein